jgi:ribosomal protein S18 acetylase RimI-like enzyme
MKIRRATEADVGAMRVLWEEFTAEATFTPYPGSPFERGLLTDHVALLAEDKRELVGTVYLNTPSPHFGYVFGLYTRPAARRQGVALALMRAVAAYLEEQGRQYVILSVDTPNEGARAFYDRLGFVDAARTLRAEVGALLD